MQIPVQISFRDFAHSDAVELAVRKRAERLERFHPGIISCRVILEAPHRKHQTGNTFHVRIDLKVPGYEIVTGKSPTDGAHKDIYVAIRDAFDVAERLLKDYARKKRIRVHYAEPAGASHGKVLRLLHDGADGFGFLLSPDGREIYFHGRSVLHEGFDDLRVGDEVRFTEEAGEEGPQASTVEMIGNAGRHLA